MPDALFAHPRLARVYDAFDGQRDDLDAYLAIARALKAERVLDVGCGTGTFALLLARSGHTVVGIDPAEESLDVARAKADADLVTWIHGDATATPRIEADLVTMTGNVAQVFLTDADWTLTLRAVRAALRPGGTLVFETRRPEARAWEQWAADAPTTSLLIPDIGTVVRRFEVTDVSPPYVSFRYTYRFDADGAVITSDSTLRFRSRDELDTTLTANGYRILEVRQAPDRPDLEFVILAERQH